jgi:hypothetical protein
MKQKKTSSIAVDEVFYDMAHWQCYHIETSDINFDAYIYSNNQFSKKQREKFTHKLQHNVWEKKWHDVNIISADFFNKIIIVGNIDRLIKGYEIDTSEEFFEAKKTLTEGQAKARLSGVLFSRIQKLAKETYSHSYKNTDAIILRPFVIELEPKQCEKKEEVPTTSSFSCMETVDFPSSPSSVPFDHFTKSLGESNSYGSANSVEILPLPISPETENDMASPFSPLSFLSSSFTIAPDSPDILFPPASPDALFGRYV